MSEIYPFDADGTLVQVKPVCDHPGQREADPITAEILCFGCGRYFYA